MVVLGQPFSGNFLGQLFIQGVKKKPAKKFLSIDASRPTITYTTNLRENAWYTPHWRLMQGLLQLAR